MKNNFNISIFGCLLASMVLVTACSKDNGPRPEVPEATIEGVYVLNQGGGADNSELSYFDLVGSSMKNDFFVAANPGKKLGSGANDMEIYGSKLYVTVEGSNKVEVLNAASGVVLETVVVAKPRYVAFHGKHAFVSSHTDKVIVIDTATYAIVKEIPVGRTPEQMAVSGDKLFVANAGWVDYVFNGGKYDNTVSVIDANALTVVKTIEVEDNIVQVHADQYNHVYVNAQTVTEADWMTIAKPARLFVLNAQTYAIEKKYDFGAEHMAVYKDKAYLFTKDEADNKTRFLELNTKDLSVQEKPRFESSTTLFGIEVDPSTGDIWVADAVDYISPGKVYHYQAKSGKAEAYQVGILPSKFVFKKQAH